MTRLPHAVLDCESRTKKGRKIVVALQSKTDLTGRRVLEVGTGSGIIAHYISGIVGSGGKVTAVDVADQRQITGGYDFELVEDCRLPFPDASFDVVVSNHVFEHVGNLEQQADHLREIRRVLRDDGFVYFAVPNRWTVVEPHFRLAFLSWLPPRVRSAYLRLSGRGAFYDCNPPSHRRLVGMFQQARLRHEQFTFKAMRIMAAVEAPSPSVRRLLVAPVLLQRVLYPVIPTMVFILTALPAGPPPDR
jgi:ubiquinone/menaquinone biosynthesis C-methylase UbiE